MGLSREWTRKVAYLLDTLPEYFCEEVGALRFTGFVTKERLSLEEAKKRECHEWKPGMRWGEYWEYAWMFSSLTLPEEREGKRFVIQSDNGEGTVFVNGQVVGAFDKKHTYITLEDAKENGRDYEIAIEVYAGHGDPRPRIGAVNEKTKRSDPRALQQEIRDGKLCEWKETAFRTWLDMKLLYELGNGLREDSQRRVEIEKGIKKACSAIDLELSPKAREESMAAADQLLAPLLACENGPTMPTMYAIGHSHLDLEWLWTDAETRRKAARTLGNQLSLIREYGNYKYLQSQPWLLDGLKKEYPELYTQVKEAAANGNIIVEGGMWVEADILIPSGESLVRQFLYGKRFIREEFGTDSKILWLPDVFGCSGSIPQIMKGCGVEYFVNAKIPWVYNGGEVFPYTSFYWKGIDGTEVLTHIIQDYSSELFPSAIFERWRMCNSKEDAAMRIYPFGYGDGGGGATRVHLELAAREEDLEGLPRVKLADPLEFFRDLEKKELSQRYSGELYYPAHRGIYTSQARMKKLNRKAELALREAEMCGALFGGIDKAVLDDGWKCVLFRQFHDIIPGSAIREVYEEAEASVEKVIESAKRAAGDALAGAVCGQEEALTLFNSLSWDRKAIVPLPNGVSGAFDKHGRSLPVQKWDDVAYASVWIPSCGMESISLSKEGGLENGIHTDEALVLENARIRAEFNSSGEMVSIRDKESGNEFLRGVGNRFRMFIDMPAFFDAWDIDSFYETQETPLPQGTEIGPVTRGPLFSYFQMKKVWGDSSLTQTVVLREDARQIDFYTDIDWQETHKLLKVYFDTNLNSEELVSEVQFGYVKRPANRNNQYAIDRYEVCQHKWSALLENKRGLALLNDSKYGIGACNGVMSLTLLKSAAAPDFGADRGKQSFVYSVLLSEDVTQMTHAAYELNVPVLSAPGKGSGRSFFKVSQDNIILDTVKLAEDGSGDIVVRMYECSNSMTKCQLKCPWKIRKARLTDMLEENGEEVQVGEDVVALEFRGFEIKTLRLTIA